MKIVIYYFYYLFFFFMEVLNYIADTEYIKMIINLVK